MDIKLRLDEKRRLDVELYAEGAMHLKMIGVQSRRVTKGAGNARDRNCLGLVEGDSSAADAAFHQRNDARAGDRLVHCIEIVKSGTKLQPCCRQVIGLREAERIFAVNAKVRSEH